MVTRVLTGSSTMAAIIPLRAGNPDDRVWDERVDVRIPLRLPPDTEHADAALAVYASAKVLSIW